MGTNTMPTQKTDDYRRNYYVSDRAIEKLREKLAPHIKDIASKGDRELGNALDEAVYSNRNTPREEGKWVIYDYQGEAQVCVDISGYFGENIKISAVMADNDSPRAGSPKFAVITVAEGDYFDRLMPIDFARPAPKSTMADVMPATLRHAKLPSLADRAPEKLPEGILVAKDTRLINYRDRDGKEQYEERLAEEASQRVSILIDAGIPPAAIRIWKPAKTKTRVLVEVE